MKKALPIIMICCAIVIGGCASKRLAKRGLKYEQAGMYEMAAEMFYQSIQANSKNVDAAIGLKKNGQRVLDDKFLEVNKAYFNGNDRETVYHFLDALAYRDKVGETGVSLQISSIAQSHFNEAKPRYLESLYNEARLLLDEERFRESEQKFTEIKRIDPNYQGIDEHMKVSRSEPIYREGLQALNDGSYRKAYHNFNNIITSYGSYKDSRELREDALSKALITIAFAEISNKTRKSGLNKLLESKISSALTNLSNPFIKVVDIENIDQLIEQQIQGTTMGSDIQVGKIYAAKALLTGSVITFQAQEGKPETETKKGFIKEIITVKDKDSGEEKKENRYHKVTYKETKRTNTVIIAFEYRLTSVETGAVMVSDAINTIQMDAIHFAEYEGDQSRLVPGYWEHAHKDSPKDKVNDNTRATRELQNLLKANRNIKSVNLLQNAAIDDVANRVALKINVYNPEK